MTTPTKRLAFLVNNDAFIRRAHKGASVWVYRVGKAVPMDGLPVRYYRTPDAAIDAAMELRK